MDEGTDRLFILRSGLYDDSRGAYSCAGSVATLDLDIGVVLNTIAIGRVPLSIAVDKRTRRVVVVSSGGMDDAPQGTISMIDGTTGLLLTSTTLNRRPLAGALAKGTGRLFVLSISRPTSGVVLTVRCADARCRDPDSHPQSTLFGMTP